MSCRLGVWYVTFSPGFFPLATGMWDSSGLFVWFDNLSAVWVSCNVYCRSGGSYKPTVINILALAFTLVLDFAGSVRCGSTGDRVFNSVKNLPRCFLKWRLLFWIHTFSDREFLLSYKALWTLNSICVCECRGVRMRRGSHFNWCFNIPLLFGPCLKCYSLVCKHWNLHRRLESLPPSVTDSRKQLRLKEKGSFPGVLSGVECGM